MKSCALAICAAASTRSKIGLGIAEGDVARDRFVKHVVLLQDHPDVPAHVAVVERLQIDADRRGSSLRSARAARRAA